MLKCSSYEGATAYYEPIVDVPSDSIWGHKYSAQLHL
jgi:hypothetical protein